MTEIRTIQDPRPPLFVDEQILRIFDAQEPEGGRQGSVYDALAKRTEELSATALEVPLAEVEERLRHPGTSGEW